MALDNIPTLGPGSLNSNLDKVLVYKNGGSEVAVSLLTLTNSALNLSGVYLDSINGRVGINNPTPVTALDVIGAGRFYQSFGVGVPSLFAYNGRAEVDSTLRLDNPGGGKLYFGGVGLLTESSVAFGQLSAPSARVHIKGSGATSATTSLLVQNSSGVTSTEIQDDGTLRQYRQAFFQNNSGILSFASDRISMQAYTSFFLKYRAVNLFEIGATEALDVIGMQVGRGVTIYDAGASTAMSDSAKLQINSTTRGFLKPRLTTVQKNAIVTPAAGLEIYDTDLNRPCFYNGTSWITL